jgi:hypothetical protein
MKLRSTLPSGCGGVGTAMKMNLAMIDTSFRAGGEAKAFGGDVFLDQSFEAGLVDGDLAGEECLDFTRVIVHADDVMSDFGEAGACGESDVTGTDDGKFHEAEKME